MKERFPIFDHHPDLCYLDSAATTHKPRELIDALFHFYAEEYATVHRALYRPSLLATDRYNATREKVKELLHAREVEEIVFTRGTTDSLNLVARSYGKRVLQTGDEIIVTEMEHHSNLVPWQMIAKETGASLRVIPVDDEGNLLWKGVISSKTKIVAVAHISNVLGTLNPIAEIALEAHRFGAVVVVDGAQSAPHMLIDVQNLDCDFFAFSAHKCYGPTGLGILYGKKALLEQMDPVEGGGDMVVKVDLLEATYQEPPLRFEAGTPIIGSVVAFKSSLDFMEEVGLGSIQDHGLFLLQEATARILEIPGVSIVGTTPQKGAILTFTIKGIHPLDVASLLDLEQIAIRTGHLCAQPILRRFGLTTAMRASFGIYNTVEDVERFTKTLSIVLGQLRKETRV